jgi:threonine dehydrogenase-like Zn-dependent dehydrogenase
VDRARPAADHPPWTTAIKPKTYKAALFRGPGRVDVVDLPYPECGDDEAIVRNVLTGICGSDIFAFQKHGPTSRIWIDEEFGHEGIAEVVKLGRDGGRPC